MHIFLTLVHGGEPCDATAPSLSLSAFLVTLSHRNPDTRRACTMHHAPPQTTATPPNYVTDLTRMARPLSNLPHSSESAAPVIGFFDFGTMVEMAGLTSLEAAERQNGFVGWAGKGGSLWLWKRTLVLLTS